MSVVRDNPENVIINNVDVLKKNMNFRMIVKLDSLIEKYYVRNLGKILNHWTYPTGEKDLRPFKLKEIAFEEQGFTVVFTVKIKHKEIDEIYLLCVDLIKVFNYDKVHVTEIKIELV